MRDFTYTSKSAVIAGDADQYRYQLERWWCAELPAMVVIGLNPSTADALNDDPTIRRCVDFARRWGMGRLIMVNLFAYRATSPDDLYVAAHPPVGPDNDYWLKLAVADENAGIVMAAWGNHGTWLQRNEQVCALIKPLADLYCWRINAGGQPAHPLYQKGTAEPKIYQRRAI